MNDQYQGLDIDAVMSAFKGKFDDMREEIRTLELRLDDMESSRDRAVKHAAEMGARYDAELARREAAEWELRRQAFGLATLGLTVVVLLLVVVVLAP